MELTWDPANKAHAKKEAHPLELEPVPMLQVNSKPAGKNDGETSVRTSSTPPPDAPSTPNKAAKKSQSKQVSERHPSVCKPHIFFLCNPSLGSD